MWMSGHQCEAWSLRDRGQTAGQVEIPTRKEKHGEQILPDVAASILKKLEERKIRREDVAGVGMGIPAPVDSEGVVQQTANVGWDIRKLQENSANCLTVCGRSRNDANVAAMARCAGRKRQKNVVMVTLAQVLRV